MKRAGDNSVIERPGSIPSTAKTKPDSFKRSLLLLLLRFPFKLVLFLSTITICYFIEFHFPTTVYSQVHAKSCSLDWGPMSLSAKDRGHLVQPKCSFKARSLLPALGLNLTLCILVGRVSYLEVGDGIWKWVAMDWL